MNGDTVVAALAVGAGALMLILALESVLPKVPAVRRRISNG